MQRVAWASSRTAIYLWKHVPSRGLVGATCRRVLSARRHSRLIVSRRTVDTQLEGYSKSIAGSHEKVVTQRTTLGRQCCWRSFSVKTTDVRISFCILFVNFWLYIWTLAHHFRQTGVGPNFDHVCIFQDVTECMLCETTTYWPLSTSTTKIGMSLPARWSASNLMRHETTLELLYVQGTRVG